MTGTRPSQKRHQIIILTSKPGRTWASCLTCGRKSKQGTTRAAEDGLCPDFARSLGGTGRNYAALWRPKDAEAVRAWARSAGVELRHGGDRG